MEVTLLVVVFVESVVVLKGENVVILVGDAVDDALVLLYSQLSIGLEAVTAVKKVKKNADKHTLR